MASPGCDAAGGSGWRGDARRRHTPLSCRAAARSQKSSPRSPLGPPRLLGRLLGALGQQPRQELRCFSLDLERLLVLLELVLELLVAASEPVDLSLEGAARGAPDLGGETSEGADLLGPAPLDDVARVEALPAQERRLFARVRAALVLLQDRQLVGGTEPPPPRLGRRVLSRHDAIIDARDQRRSRHGHGSTCSCLALGGWSATAGVSRKPDRQGSCTYGRR